MGTMQKYYYYPVPNVFDSYHVIIFCLLIFQTVVKHRKDSLEEYLMNKKNMGSFLLLLIDMEITEECENPAYIKRQLMSHVNQEHLKGKPKVSFQSKVKAVDDARTKQSQGEL